MLITLDQDSATPLYEQLRNQIVLGIATGGLEPQEKLPTVRQLADELGMNMMTVNKAYALLKQEGYIVIDRRHGAKVSPPPERSSELSKPLQQELRLIIAEASIHGMDASRFESLCAQIFRSMANRTTSS
ncbi:GntR family transcriptional regulator [Paenibacillus sp. D51F]